MRTATPRGRSTGSIAISRAGSAPPPMPRRNAAWRFSAGFVLADLGIAHHPRPDHAAYVASWIEVLKDDPRAIFTAASKAQQAADWMHAQQPVSTEGRPASCAVPDETDAGQPASPFSLARCDRART